MNEMTMHEIKISRDLIILKVLLQLLVMLLLLLLLSVVLMLLLLVVFLLLEWTWLTRVLLESQEDIIVKLSKTAVS